MAFAAVAAILVVAFAATAAVQSTQIARERDQVARERIAQFLAPRPLLEEALAERRRLFPGDNADVAASLSRLGLLLQIEGDLPERLARLYEIRGKTGKAR